MSTSDVSRNYSRTGSELIEKIYSDDYLSIGGKASTDSLASDAGITVEMKVLDVGSGFGRTSPASGGEHWLSGRGTGYR